MNEPACDTHRGWVVPARRDPWPNFGVLALVAAAGALLTGVVMSFHYAPTLDAARDSMLHLRDEVAGGAWLLGLHHWASQFAIALAAVHGLRVFWNGGFRDPRRSIWALGCLIFLVLVGYGYTGYLLTGDERAYAGLGVMQAVAESTPFIGDVARARAHRRRHDFERDPDPACTPCTCSCCRIALVVLTVSAYAHVRRCAGPSRHPWRQRRTTRRLSPKSALRRDAIGGAVVLGLLVVCAWKWPVVIGPQADPAGAGASDAQPEWFLLWVNELLHMESLAKIPHATFILAGLLPGLVGRTVGIGLPWLFRKPERAPTRRVPELILAGVILLGIGILGARAAARAPTAEEDEEPAPTKPTEDDTDNEALDAAVAPLIKRFRCAKCHIIDGDEEGGDSGPVLWRFGDAESKLPTFEALYTREFFRLKVGDPEDYWPDTGMVYPKRAGKMTPEQLATLEAWFYDAKPPAEDD